MGLNNLGAGVLEFGFWQALGLKTGTRDDSNPVDFSTLERRGSWNDSLICAAELCPRATPDLVAPAFDLPPVTLREKLRSIALTEPRIVELSMGADVARLRFVQRSFLMHYPDVIDVLVAPAGSERSMLAPYSRSLAGQRDFGVNRARLERWLAAISR